MPWAQPFTAPEVRPATRCFWTMKVRVSAGDDHHHRERAHAAPVDGELGRIVEQADRQRLGVDRAGQLRGQREFVPGGQEGEDRGRRDAGPASGNSTCQNACQRVQPSICAASARSFGTWRKKPSISQIVNGTLSAT